MVPLAQIAPSPLWGEGGGEGIAATRHHQDRAKTAGEGFALLDRLKTYLDDHRLQG